MCSRPMHGQPCSSFYLRLRLHACCCSCSDPAAPGANEKLTDELYGSTKELFELADFVKFAKHVADDSENAAALPLSVRFVTSTYQSVLEDETPQAGTENGTWRIIHHFFPKM